MSDRTEQSPAEEFALGASEGDDEATRAALQRVADWLDARIEDGTLHEEGGCWDHTIAETFRNFAADRTTRVNAP